MKVPRGSRATDEIALQRYLLHGVQCCIPLHRHFDCLSFLDVPPFNSLIQTSEDVLLLLQLALAC